ncbi:MAG TPA: pyridoxamine kinase [Clostridiales bacterium]|nr:pyridoxamine kinase [Clostridiales bacterium]
MSTTRILTIQDISCFGQCSITVALPILSAMGIETAIIPSAVLSTHTGGFTGYTFRDLTEDLPAIGAHWQKQGIAFDAFYTGYIGSKQQLNYIKNIVNTSRKEGALFVVDPVMGDNGKLYAGFDKAFASEMAAFLKGADVILPNLTEAAYLLNEPYLGAEYTEAQTESLVRRLSALSGGNVVLTGVSFDKAKLGVAIYERNTDRVHYYFEDRIEGSFHGTGDVYASVFTGALLRGYSLREAAALAVDFTVRAIRATLPDREEHAYGVKFEQAIPYLIKRLSD